VDVTPAPRRSSYQQKTPAADWQARERVGMSFCSADTLTYEEKRSCDVHAVTIAVWAGESISPGAMSCDPEGRSGALVNAC
jgi:hypothetical protein